MADLTDDPELRFTGGGAAVATLRVASNRRYTNRQGDQQEETTYLNVNCWRDLAENAAESLKKGDRVIVIGRIRVRSYENREGQTVWTTEIEADEVAPSLPLGPGTCVANRQRRRAGCRVQHAAPTV